MIILLYFQWRDLQNKATLDYTPKSLKMEQFYLKAGITVSCSLINGSSFEENIKKTSTKYCQVGSYFKDLIIRMKNHNCAIGI